MKTAIYRRTGPAHEVLEIVEREAPMPGPGEVRVRLAWSGVNPSDTKSRAGTRSPHLPFPEVTPHSDGAGIVVHHLPPAARAHAQAQLTTWLAEGRLQHRIAARLPLARIADAHALVESARAIGNVVVALGADA